jgi:ADP-ribosylglycohydrolase
MHPEKPVGYVFMDAAQFVEEEMTLTGIETVIRGVETAITYAEDPELSPLAALSMLGCTTAVSCMAGAIYCASVHPGNFDEGMISAVNHSGRSCAVGALTGAILGAKMGVEALPDFYLDSLEGVDVLAELAEDIIRHRQLMCMFDHDWEQKYTFGMPAT